MITYTYGAYVSNLHGCTVMLDPLLPPKKCPVDCVICPLGGTKIHLNKLSTPSPLVSKLLKDLEENKPRNVRINTVMIWGFGDPLLIENVDDVISKVAGLLRDEGIDAKIVLHSSLVYARSVEKILSTVSSINVPYIWYGEDRRALGWVTSRSFADYLESLKHLSKLEKGKIVPELFIFRIGSEHYPSLDHLSETLVHLSRAGFEEVVVKPAERPSPGHSIKPPSPSYIEKVVEELESKGIRAVPETTLIPESPFEWNNVYTSLYNHVLRIALRYEEVKFTYGDLGVIALNNLISRRKIVLIHWGGTTFYKAII
ncbi:MAG: hypothetical protein QXE77_00125 [Desulfurococcaceae archaeon]